MKKECDVSTLFRTHSQQLYAAFQILQVTGSHCYNGVVVGCRRLDVVEDRFSSSFTGCSASWFTHSVFRVWKKLSETALSQFVPLRLMLCWMPCCLSSFRWLLPRLVCQSKPLAGLRCQVAIISASLTNLVFHAFCHRPAHASRE